MHAPSTTSEKPPDLTTCENEPIQIPGAVQPHGMLLAIDAQSGRILSVSANAEQFLSKGAPAFLNANIESLFGEGALERLRSAVESDARLTQVYVERRAIGERAEVFDVIAHRSENAFIVELEPAELHRTADPELFLDAVRTAVTRIQAELTFEDLTKTIVHEIAHLSGFERVMLYRFDRDWNGEVIAEVCPSDLAPWLGLHYPASDIPRQARELYRRNMLRLIPDARYEPVPLVPTINPVTERPLDLSLSVLRSVSPVHLEYLANMNVRATLTISLLKHGQLWGMIAGHHRSPKYTSYRVRTACELIGRTASLQIATHEDSAESEQRLRLRSLQPALLEALNREGEFGEAIATGALLEIAGAEGAAIKTEGEPQLVGKTPRMRDVRHILAWLEERDKSDGDQPFVTARLPLENPNFSDIKDTACGLLAVPLTTTKGGWILWFRPEVVRTVTWGGDPRKPVVDDGRRISPRKSFEAWKEHVNLHALPWQNAQIEAAVELRRLVSDVMMRRAREYAQLNAQLARSNQELESFAHVASHDLKEPLRGIHHYASFLVNDYSEKMDDQGRQMLASMASLAERMERQIQSLLTLALVGSDEEQNGDADANVALDDVLELLAPRLEGFAVERGDLPRVRIAQPRLREVFVNLVSNAIKYTDKDEKRIAIGVVERKRPAHRPLPATAGPESDRMATFYVTDNGIGIKEKHLESVFRMFKRLHAREAFGGGTGAGLAIARKIVEQHGGSMWVESVPNEGSTFYFTVPLAGA